jgi:hypothetical protein
MEIQLLNQRDSLSYEITEDCLKLIQRDAHGEESVILINANDLDAIINLLGNVKGQLFPPT